MLFKKRVSLSLSHLRLDGETLRFSLEKNGAPVPVTLWAQSGQEGAIFLAENFSEQTSENAYFIDLADASLMALAEGQDGYIQRTLQLSPLYDGGLQIESDGTFSQKDFAITYRFLQPNGRTFSSVKEDGCFVTVAGEVRLLPTSAWRLIRTLRALQEKLKTHDETAERMADWYEAQQLLDALPEEERLRIRESSVLQSVRLFYANAFRVEAEPQEEGYDVGVTLLRQKENSAATEDSPVEHESLLTPIDHEKFSAFFRKANSLSTCVPLEVGRYVVFEPNVRKMLQHIENVRRRTPEERTEFLKNPRAALMQEMGEDIDEEIFAAVLSDRVVGLGVWQEKIVPYVQIKGGQWIPDGKLPDGAERGVRIGDANVPIRSEEEARDIIAKCAEARQQGKDCFLYEGSDLPATIKLEESVSALYPARPEKYENSGKETENDRKKERAVIIVKDNFGDLSYEVAQRPRLELSDSEKIPEQMRTLPKYHQKKGFDWLYARYRAGFRGALLADDMGLGKTWQALAFMAWLKQAMAEGRIAKSPILIVAPTGLLKNWETEMAVHLKDGMGDVVAAYGIFAKSLRIGKSGAYRLEVQRLQSADLILTTYETLNIYQTSFAAVSCAAVIFDEMQKVKNPASQITSAANGLKADFWLGMTGTPVENRLCDLWCITDILQPGWLGSVKEFSHTYEKPIADGKGHAHLESLTDKITGEAIGSPAYMLRRMKGEALEGLPKKHVHPIQETMATRQAEAYLGAIHAALAKDEKGGQLRALQSIRAISLHPDYRRACVYADDDEFIEASARTRICFRLLEDIRKKKEKALIFVEYDCWHQRDFMPLMLKRRFGLEETPMVINGSVHGGERQKRVERFQSKPEGFDVMLISPKAGGVGLTITAANHVIHLSRWWNPAVEDQATDRVYRIGQKRDVHVYYPIAMHPDIKSFDVCLNELLENKRRLSRNTLLPVVESDGTVSDLYTQTTGKCDTNVAGIHEISAMTGKEFQDYALHRLCLHASTFGLRARSAPSSWDGGADIILEDASGEIIAVIQCKKCADMNHTKSGSDDAERALINYNVGSRAFSVVLTNARASAKDIAWRDEYPEKRLLIEKENACFPEKMLSVVANFHLR